MLPSYGVGGYLKIYKKNYCICWGFVNKIKFKFLKIKKKWPIYGVDKF